MTRLRRIAWTASLIGPLAACDPSSADLAERRETEPVNRGPRGRADGPAGSRVGACGDRSAGECWCDPACVENEDCCADYEPLCLEEEPAVGIDASDAEFVAVAGFTACTGPADPEAVLSSWSERGGTAVVLRFRRNCFESGCDAWNEADFVAEEDFVLDPAVPVTVEPDAQGWRVQLGSLATCQGPADELSCEIESSLHGEPFAPSPPTFGEGCGHLVLSRSATTGSGHTESLIVVRAERHGAGDPSPRLEDQLRLPTGVKLYCNRTHHAKRWTCSDRYDYSHRGDYDISMRLRNGEIEVVDWESNVPSQLQGVLEDEHYENQGTGSSRRWSRTVRVAGDRVEPRFFRTEMSNSPSRCSIRTGSERACIASFVASESPS